MHALAHAQFKEAEAEHDVAVAKLKVAGAELGVSQAKLAPPSTLNRLQSAQNDLEKAKTDLREAKSTLEWAVSERGKAAASLKKTETQLSEAKVELKNADDEKLQELLSLAQANFAAFAKVQPEMKFVQDAVKDAARLFHILEVPKSPGIGPTFPFRGKGYSTSVRELLLRESHYDLYKIILVQLGVSKLIHAGCPYTDFGHEDVGKKFVVRGPPGTGKSVMLNLIWYVALFELGMDVICHMPDDVIYLYRNGSSTVEILDKAGAENMLLKWNTVYLFDPDDKGAFEPIYKVEFKATSVIATSPNIHHYRNLLKSNIHFPSDASIVPLWSYAWTPQEITTGLKLLDLAEVESASSAVLGNFRFALNAATNPGLFNETTATELLQRVIARMSTDDLEQLGTAPSANALAEMFTTGAFLSAFRLSHSIVTQQAPELPKDASPTILGYRTELGKEPVRTLPMLIEVLKNAKVPQTVTAFDSAVMTARLYHSNFSVVMANKKAAHFLFSRAIQAGMGGVMLALLSRVSGGALGSMFEFVFLTSHHPYPYRILTFNGAWTNQTIDFSQMYCSPSYDVLKNVTRFNVQSDEKQSKDSANPHDEPPYQLVADKVYETRNQGEDQCWRFDPDNSTHRNFDFYASVNSPYSRFLVRIVMCQLTTGDSHHYRPGEYHKTAEQFKATLSKKLGCRPDQIEVIVLILSQFNRVTLKKQDEHNVTPLDKERGKNLILFVNLNLVDKEANTPAAQQANADAKLSATRTQAEAAEAKAKAEAAEAAEAKAKAKAAKATKAKA